MLCFSYLSRVVPPCGVSMSTDNSSFLFCKVNTSSYLLTLPARNLLLLLAALRRTAGGVEGPQGWLEGICRQVSLFLGRLVGGAIDVCLSPSSCQW